MSSRAAGIIVIVIGAAFLALGAVGGFHAPHPRLRPIDWDILGALFIAYGLWWIWKNRTSGS
jgi:hypothetical protein